MEEAPCISQIASLLAEPKRTAMLWSLMDGSAKTADELAMLAGLSAASANAHLARLIGSGLLRSEAKRGKRWFRVAAADVSAAVDALACTTLACAARSAPQVCPRVSLAPPPLRRARLCQGHLGGELAAGLYQRMLEAGWIDRYEQRTDVTVTGAQHFATLGIFTQALSAPLACDCFDWSQQQPHLGGALGAGLLQLFLQCGWINAVNESRALLVTDLGLAEINRLATA
ncbi:UNVERIFIED_ORG: DNA-binding transcriptional ArsR family regulator [Pseudomonas fluorescens]|jgi:DNA-binding transcriptional ArsR family regulator|uniref:DNA-binding transcriptional regulator, ArsR family n=1 Tax=Pseudomonas salomonii TaxID=191391 RepID=A0A1H3LQJ7_9PSED|nr:MULTISPECIES: helix-turn-helix transcriptional regulator [Pseudomonas]MDQ0706284.1 DNA-binding transcriptional ArsR family regulator [Pseudomonas sp. W3I7]NWF06603.1 helix-turn-helix transcriptional regulator [Pseudomonas salomonii]PIB44453.1 ArsR family transcriptional regulator [Pseudomonas sp. 2822-15]CRM61298.1 Helix-turn-helix domain protein [Pseudomonas sp. 58 R 3]SDY66125.1 DNA-binding transcriptional regulator, ArsR family [Pseudomonas salomonii]